MPREGFKNYFVTVDEKLSAVTGLEVGAKVKPTEVTRGIWAYMKENKLVPEKKAAVVAA